MSTLTAITFDPVLPATVLLLIGVATLIPLVWGAVRRASGIGWRTAVLGALWLALLNPSANSEQREPLSDVSAVVIDESHSQAVADRLSAARDTGRQITEALEALPGLEVRSATLGHDGGGDGTLLFAELSRLLADIPPERLAGTVVITDGQIHDAPDSTAEYPAPFHLLLTGRKNERDRRIAIETAPSYGIVGDAITVAVRVDDEDAQQHVSPITVSLNGKRIRRMLAGIGTSTEITFELDHAGVSALEVSVEAGERELTLDNNRAVAVINGVRDHLRVMLVSGEPNPGLRTWRNLLKADPSVDLVHFTILRPPNKQDLTPVRELSLIPFPTNELFAANLAEFDLIIFDSYHRRGILPMVYLSNVVDYVVNGGALLDSAGPAFASPLSLSGTPLGTILPGQPTGRIFRAGFKPRLTGAGFRHPVTLDLPGAGGRRDSVVGESATDATDPDWGRWFRQIDVDLESGTTLMNGFEQRPLLVLDRIGDGRVAQLLSDQSWLWARGFEGGGPQSALLRRLVHWLMKEPDLEEEDLLAAVGDDRIEITRRSLAPIEGDVTAISPDGDRRTIALADQGDGRAVGYLDADQPGLYRFEHGDHRVIAVAGGPFGRELEDVRATDTILRPHAEASGGGVVWLAGDGTPGVRRIRPGRTAAGRGWIGIVAQNQYIVTRLDQMPLVPPWLLLALALGGLMLGWRAEGR